MNSPLREVSLSSPLSPLSTVWGEWNDAHTAQVISLLQMLSANALAYVRIAQDIEFVREEVSGEAGKGSFERRLSPEIREKLLDFLQKTDTSCEILKLVKTRVKIAYLLSLYRHDPPVGNYSGAMKDTEHLRLEFMEELQAFKFLHLPKSRYHFFVGDRPDAAPFGQAVFEAFPSAALDLREASNTYALGRWPACVFHLMRVLEFGLRAMAAKFGVPYEAASWHKVIEGIEGRVRKISEDTDGPDWKKHQKEYSDAATQFMFFKDAWRNHIMHVRDVYDAGRATSIWQHVQEFMNKLAAIGLKENPVE